MAGDSVVGGVVPPVAEALVPAAAVGVRPTAILVLLASVVPRGKGARGERRLLRLRLFGFGSRFPPPRLFPV